MFVVCLGHVLPTDVVFMRIIKSTIVAMSIKGTVGVTSFQSSTLSYIPSDDLPSQNLPELAVKQVLHAARQSVSHYAVDRVLQKGWG